jgi:hypothetical protein
MSQNSARLANLMLPPELRARIDAYRAKTGASLSATVRLALDAFLKQNGV